MRDPALAFLERWTLENVVVVPGDRQAAELERLAAACIEAAADEDITEAEITEAAAEASDGDDLISYMAKAMDKAAMEELDELVDEDEDANT